AAGLRDKETEWNPERPEGDGEEEEKHGRLRDQRGIVALQSQPDDPLGPLLNAEGHWHHGQREITQVLAEGRLDAVAASGQKGGAGQKTGLRREAHGSDPPAAYSVVVTSARPLLASSSSLLAPAAGRFRGS